MQIDLERPEQLVGELLATPTAELLSLIDTWCAEHPGCVSPLGTQELDPHDHEEREHAAREDRPAFMFIDEEPLPPPHADIWVFGDPVTVRANARAIPRLKVLTDDPAAPAVFPDGSRENLGRHDHLRAATWLVRGLRQRARTYEAMVRAIVELRPDLATTGAPETTAPIELVALAAQCKLDVDTVRRAAPVIRFQTPVVTVSLVLEGDCVRFRRA